MDATIFVCFAATFYTVESAVTFTMRGENLYEFPSGIPQSVEILDLKWNRIERISATDLSAFVELKCLGLDKNRITFLEDGCFDSNTHLEILQLSGNMIAHFPISFGPLVTSLKRLTLSGSITKNVSNLNLSSISRINWISLRENNFDAMEIDIISLLPPNTQQIALDSCSMNRFPDFDTHIPGINGIMLTENNLTKLSPAYFKNLKQLRILKLSRNNLKSIPDLYDLSSLTDLHLNGNPLVCNNALCWMIMWPYMRTSRLTLDAATCQSPYHLQDVLLTDLHPLNMHCYNGK